MGAKDEQIFKKRNAAKPHDKPVERFNGDSFVNYELNKAQSAALKAQPNDMNSIFDSLEGMINDGYKITIKFDDRNNCFAAFLFAPPDGSDNAGLILTGRGSTAGKAVKQVLYKHFVCLPNGWREFAERRSDITIDD